METYDTILKRYIAYYQKYYQEHPGQVKTKAGLNHLIEQQATLAARKQSIEQMYKKFDLDELEKKGNSR